MKKNDILKIKDLDFKKPAIGINAKYFRQVIGKKLKNNLKSGTFLKFNKIV